MEDIFIQRPNIPYNLRDNDGLLVTRANTTVYGIETIRYVGSRLWPTLPIKIKESRILEIFKGRIKNRQQTNSPASSTKYL